MPAPKGNKFAVGGKGGGRKGYVFEKKQMDEMLSILGKTFTMVKKIQSGKASSKEIARFQTTLRFSMKIFDKIHANKQHIDWDDDKRIPFKMIIIQKSDGKTEEKGKS